MGKSRNGRRDNPPIPFASSEVEMPLDLTLPRRVSRLRSTRTAIGGFALMLPLASLWRIARRDLAARIRGLRLLAVCLFLGVAPLAAIASQIGSAPRRESVCQSASITGVAVALKKKKNK